MSDEQKEILKRTDAFQASSEDELAAISGFAAAHEFKNGQRLFKDGDPAENLWVIAKGMIDLRFEMPGRKTSDEQTISTLTKNQILGWSSLIPPHKYKLSAYCISQTCHVLKIDAEKFCDYLRQHPASGYRILAAMIRVVGKRFQKLQSAIGQAPFAGATITVHMGDCGISAGAREVMTALTDEMSRTTRHNIRAVAGNCLGRCRNEPNVTVAIDGEDPVMYQFMDAEKMHRVFSEHVIKGNVQTDLVLEGGTHDNN